jgi:hypothetical protein
VVLLNTERSANCVIAVSTYVMYKHTEWDSDTGRKVYLQHAQTDRYSQLKYSDAAHKPDF